MTMKHGFLFGVVATLGVALWWLAPGGSAIRGNAMAAVDEHGVATDDVVKGPHGGRLLTGGDFAVEVTIYERGVPPEFRVYAFESGRPIDSAEPTLEITLRRFGGRGDRFRFQKRDDYLVGDGTVEEPHSFDVEVVAAYRGKTHRWTYPSYEGRTEISPEAIASSGISIETVGPAAIRTTIKVNGRIVPNEDHLSRVIPRYPGVVKEVRKRLGDAVVQGDVLAIVESNQSLQPYAVKSPIAGTVIGKNVIAGEFVREGHTIYTVADLGTVWADLTIPHREFRQLRLGQRVTLQTGDDGSATEGTIAYLSPLGAESTQTLLARAVIPNPTGEWRPGLFVTAEILVGEATVPTAVKPSALQRFRDWDVVFLNEGTVFQAQPIELGRRDSHWVEVVEGVKAGDRYAAENSFVVKADVGKSGATHDH